MAICQTVDSPWAFNLNALLVVIFGIANLMIQIATLTLQNSLKT